jgi:hypothetical protein
MGKVSIYGAGRPIKEIFSRRFVFSVPRFQRPYAWAKEQAGELIDDLTTFIGDGKKPLEELNPYFLGSIVLIMEEGKSEAQIVDGQQRLTTLTILLAVLRKLLSSQTEYQSALTGFLYDKADPITGTPPQYRLTLREQDKVFFRDNIQQEGGLDNLETLYLAGLSDSQKKIRENALLFLEKLEKLDENTQIYLLRAIANNCFLVEISTPDLESAYRVFSVLNSRGLNLSHTDILKADIVGAIESEQDVYNSKWEEIEDELGREVFQSLFAYIRTIERKVKPQDTILKEIQEHVRPKDNPEHFIDKVLIPYAVAFSTIRNMNYQNAEFVQEVNGLFKWLNRIDNSDWIPPALLFFSRNYNDPKEMVHFFTDLERLAAGLMILRANINKRIERYGRLLTAIQNNYDLYTSNSPLQLNDEEQRDIIESLNGNLYENGYCKYVLVRLDEALSDDKVSHAYSSITIEHVLPQNPEMNSLWMALFPNTDEHEKYIHRLGNLVLLSQRKNTKAANKEFLDKRDTYFRTSTGVTTFALTVEVLGKSEWTSSVIEQRQQDLLNNLRDIWCLN